MGKLKGVIPVIPTPFTDDGKYVDYGNFEDIVDIAIRDESACNLSICCWCRIL